MKRKSKLFTSAQIEELREKYSDVDYVDPLQPAYQSLIRLLSSLSQPQLAQLSKSKIKFVSPLAWNRLTKKSPALKLGAGSVSKGSKKYLAYLNRRKNPIKRPGKFEGEMYAGRFAYENVDEELGDVQDFGWYGNFSGKIKGRGPFHIIVREDSQGFVYGEFFDTEKQMRKAWRGLEREYEHFVEHSE